MQFYTTDIFGAEATLTGEESRHCAQVLRMRVGEELILVDGKGGYYNGVLTDIGKRECKVAIREAQQEYGKRSFRVHLAVAPTKNMARWEWMLEKATEVGVDQLTPLLCKRSERVNVRLDRLEKIAISAMKQSGQAYLPVIAEPMTFSDMVTRAAYPQRFIPHLLPGVKTSLALNCEPEKDVLILIGPEGDFTPEEIEQALSLGYQPVTLGTPTLRTETAGLIALAAVHFANK
ncbi:MAG: 16S rRNA (uracil(1498)-N(3))-methyltransferase [Saprospirales bacterium]|nr:16S rRNA (uracil(1498)-N(3))-methyltransferase [Saprospirales bacterium]